MARYEEAFFPLENREKKASRFALHASRASLQLTGDTHGLTGQHENHIRDTYEYYEYTVSVSTIRVLE